MNPRHVALIAAVAALALLAGVAAYLHDDGWSIAYETDGGSFGSDVPCSYQEGDSFALPVPERDGFVFMGWYLDRDLTDKVDSVGGLRGDLTLHASWIEAVNHSLEYVLDGGSLPEGSADSFVGGVGVVLPVPEREGMVFGGWFEDPGLTVPIVVVGADVFDDVTVYACWETGTVVGTGVLWDVHGVYYNGDIRHTVDGTVRQEVIAERGGAYYSETISDLTYSWPSGSTRDEGVRGGWSDGQGTELRYVGVAEANGYMCTVWESDDGTRYWLYHMVLQVRAEIRSDGMDIVHDLVEVYSFDPVQTFMPDVSVEYPLTVDGVAEIPIGDTLVLTASGEGFTGWYAGGRLVTEDRTLRVDRADPTGSYEARAGGYTVVDQTSCGLGDFGFGPDSVITMWDGTETSAGFGSLEPGYYVVADIDGPVRIYMEFFVDEVRTYDLVWTYKGVRYSIGVEMRYSDVFRYTYGDPYGNVRISMTDQGYVSNYHTVDDPYLRGIAGTLVGYGQGMDRTELAELILSFVQSVTYITDEDSTGRSEYWKYPLETLWNGGGDCEDKAILYDTLMMVAGYDVAFVLFQDHAMSAVAVDADGHSLVSDGTEYVFCETTNDWDIGVTSVGHTEVDVYYWCSVLTEIGTDTDINT